MDTSPRLALPYLLPNQAQKHVTHNEALRRLDAMVQLSVAGRDLTAPPASPGEGECWLVAAGATGDWAGHENEIAAWQDGAWAFIAPGAGWLAWVANEAALCVWSGSAWQEALQNIPHLGIGTEADAANPFAAKLNKALWSARYAAEGGDGDLRYTMNKEAPGDTLSLLMQSGWSGRAELGLTGDDDLHLKVSADGTAWKEAMTVERASGTVRFPQGQAHALSGLALSDLVFTPGGDGTVSIWRIEESHGQNPRGATIAGVSGDTLSLSASVAGQFGRWTGYMTGVSMVRIWNMSLDPVQSAWVKASPSDTQLTVHDAADLAGWTAGHTIQLGDPETITPGRVIAVDISPMLENLFGAAFPQRGLMLRSTLFGDTAGDLLGVTPTGGAGSNMNSATTQVPGIRAGDGATLIACSEPSPVSDSNLIFVTETFASTAGIELLSCMGVFV
nr:DUF2793 domain-containing protein [uncultured Hyphomonas sp.]